MAAVPSSPSGDWPQPNSSAAASTPSAASDIAIGTIALARVATKRRVMPLTLGRLATRFGYSMNGSPTRLCSTISNVKPLAPGIRRVLPRLRRSVRRSIGRQAENRPSRRPWSSAGCAGGGMAFPFRCGRTRRRARSSEPSPTRHRLPVRDRSHGRRLLFRRLWFDRIVDGRVVPTVGHADQSNQTGRNNASRKIA